MSDLKISALPSATLPLAGTEIIPLVQGGVTSKALASDLFQWPGGRVSYVPVGGNIQAYVTAATAGDTLILGAGTYTVTSTITVDKAILIKGQGLSATKVVTSTADLAVFTLAASTARVSDLYVGNTGTGTSFAFYAGDGLSQLQISNVIAVLGGNGLKYGIWSQSSITVSNCEMYITSANLNSNGVMIYNDNAATVNISANIQNVRVLSTGATLNNRGIVFNNNDTSAGAFTIAGNVTNCNLTAYASTGVTDIALYVNSTTTNNVTVNAYNSLFNGADSDVTVIGTNSCTLSNCTLTHGTATGTVVYAGTQVVAKLNGNTITTGTGVLTLAAGKTLTASNSLTLAGTDATTQTFPTTSATIARTDAAQTFTGLQTFATATASTALLSGTTSALNSAANRGNITVNGSSDSVLAFGIGGVSSHFILSDSGGVTYYAANDLYQRFYTNGAIRLLINSTSTDVTGKLSATGVVTFSNYGAGAATFSAAGVISSVSDETWKVKDGIPTNPEAMLNKLKPGYWYYNAEKAPTYGADRQLGFYAQNVNAAIGPEAAPEPEDGKPWGYYDRSVLAVTVMSLQNALSTIENLSSRISALEAKCL